MAIGFYGDSPCDFVSKKEYEWDSYIDCQMDYYKKDAIKRLQVIVDSKFAEEIAVSLACASNNGLKEAESILHQAYIEDKHIFSLLEDRDSLDTILWGEKYS